MQKSSDSRFSGFSFLCSGFSNSHSWRLLHRSAALALLLCLLFTTQAKLSAEAAAKVPANPAAAMPAEAAAKVPATAAAPAPAAAAAAATATTTAATPTGWQEIKGIWYYYDAKGKPVTGFKTISGKKYYFMDSRCNGYTDAKKGQMATGWKKIAGNFYYFTDSQYPAGKTEGQMLNGWRTISGNRYYLGSDGVRRTGFQRIDGKRYYFSDYRCSAKVKGVMMKGLRIIAGKTYYFNSNGVMQTGWVTHGGVREYFGKNGVRFVPLVVLDPGHSSDVAPGTVPLGPGAKEQKAADSLGTRGVETGVYEYELNLTIAQKLQKDLESRGYKVLLTRTKNTGTYSCVARAEVANKNKADAFVRIHANAYKDSARTGAMTICIKKTNPYCPQTYEKSQLLSAKILNTYFKVVGCRREHVWETDTMTGNNWSQVPTTLIEMGYMTNPEEDKLMQTPEYQAKMVQGIADGIDAYFQAVVK